MAGEREPEVDCDEDFEDDFEDDFEEDFDPSFVAAKRLVPPLPPRPQLVSSAIGSVSAKADEREVRVPARGFGDVV